MKQNRNDPTDQARCPNCDYSLRGLPGAVVTCPECGITCDIAAILHLRRQDWARNGHYRSMSRPVQVFQLGILLPGFLLVPLSFVSVYITIGVVIYYIIALSIWGRMIDGVHRAWPRLETWRLIILLHFAIIGYAITCLVGFISLLMLLFTMVRVIQEGLTQVIVTQLIGSAGGLFIGIIGLPVFFLIDRYVGRRCIRRSLVARHIAEHSVVAPDEEDH